MEKNFFENEIALLEKDEMREAHKRISEKSSQMSDMVSLIKKTLEEEIIDKLPEYEGCQVDVREIAKNNRNLTAFILTGESVTGKAVPMLYLKDFLGLEDREVVRNIKSVFQMPDLKLDLSSITRWEQVKDNLYPRLIKKEGNGAYLENKIQKDFLDLSIIYGISLDVDSGQGNVPVTSQLMDSWEVSESDIHDVAFKNLEKKFQVIPMGTMLEELAHEPVEIPEEVPMAVITCDDKLNGSAALASEELMKQVASFVKKEKFYILPSSIHECIVLTEEDADPDHLREMVKIVNDTEVSIDEILSYSVYKYENGAVTIA